MFQVLVETWVTGSGRRQLTFQTNILWCDCIVKSFTWLRRSASITSSSRNITLCIFWRTGSLCIVCNCRHNTYQIAVVRHSLSLSYLRHNISSPVAPRQPANYQRSRRSCSFCVTVREMSLYSRKLLMSYLFYSSYFFIHFFYTPETCGDCLRSHSD